MPLLDHFHPPLHGPRRWEGFLHDWATFIAQQLNETLPKDYFAVTDADGKFEIKNAPAGKCRLLAWKDGAGWLTGDRKGREITIKANGTVEMSLTAKPDEP